MANAFGVSEKADGQSKTEDESLPEKKTVSFDLPAVEDVSTNEAPSAKEETNDSETESESESDDEDYRGLRKRKEATKDDLEVVPAQKKQKALTAAELALGQQLVTSRKRKNEIMDDAYHRFVFKQISILQTTVAFIFCYVNGLALL